jgi:hypothetical protein
MKLLVVIILIAHCPLFCMVKPPLFGISDIINIKPHVIAHKKGPAVLAHFINTRDALAIVDNQKNILKTIKTQDPFDCCAQKSFDASFIESMTIDPQTGQIAVSAGGKITILDPTSLKIINTLNTPQNIPAPIIEYSPDSKSLACFCEKNFATLDPSG